MSRKKRRKGKPRPKTPATSGPRASAPRPAATPPPSATERPKAESRSASEDPRPQKEAAEAAAAAPRGDSGRGVMILSLIVAFASMISAWVIVQRKDEGVKREHEKRILSERQAKEATRRANRFSDANVELEDRQGKLAAQISQLTKERDSLRAEAATRKAERRDLDLDLVNLRKKASDLEKRSQGAAKNKRLLETVVRRLTTQRGDLEKEITAAQIQGAKWKRALRALNKEFDALKLASSTEKARSARVIKKLQAQAARTRELSEAAATLAQECEEWKLRCREAREQGTVQAIQLGAIQGEVDRQRAETARLEERELCLLRESDAQVQQIDALEEAVARLREQSAKRAVKAADEKKELARAKAKVEDLSAALSLLSDRQSQLLKRERKMEQELNERSAALKQSQKARAALHESLKRKEVQVATYKDEAAIIRGKLKQAEQRSVELSEAKDKLEARIAELEKKKTKKT